MRAIPSLLAATALLAPGASVAGGAKTAAGCNCTPPPPPSCCNAPTTHTISVPGVYVVPPSVYIAPSRLFGGVGVAGAGASAGAGAEAGVASDISVSVQASSSAAASASGLAAAAAASAASANGYGSALATANSQAANLLAASSYASGGGGGGGSFFSEGGSSGNIPSLIVAAPAGAATSRQVCARTAASVQAVAVQAVCLDDKDVPHPASQVTPDRDVAEGYAGELFRCIAGAHMQYVTAAWAGEARFDHGQTVVCRKGEALWRDAGGHLQCRPQTPARDCNERSLLRRYGAGIKVLKASVAGQCVEWRTESVQAEAAWQGGLQLDGGVGG